MFITLAGMAITTAKAAPCIGCHAYTTAGTHFMDATAKKLVSKGITAAWGEFLNGDGFSINEGELERI